MQKAYTEADLIALIDQYKSRKAYALHCINDPAYVQSSLNEIDTQVAALLERRARIVEAVELADALILECDAKMANLRKKLAFVRKHGGVGKLLALKAQAERLKKELGSAID